MARLTSILQVMIPGSLPTARKALLRDMARGFPGLKHHRASREVTPLRAGSLPDLSSATRPHPHGASLHRRLTATCEMTCPSSGRKPADRRGGGGAHGKFCTPLATSLVNSSGNRHDCLPKG